jgi:adenine-specific DNA-methyltransferase
MIEADLLESRRLEIQRQFDLTKTRAERNRLGQFATPASFALDIVNHAKLLLPPGANIHFLDPALGTGTFVSALLQVFSAFQITGVAGYEIDPLYADFARDLWKNIALQVHLADFTKAMPPEGENDKFNLLICNPPYVRHHHLTKEEKQRLQNVTEKILGIKVSERSGLYCYFLWLAHRWLAEDGLAGWLIPSEFMSVNYGQQVRAYLLEHVTLLRIHSFAPSDVQFNDALVSSALIWFRKSLPPTNHVVEFTYGGTFVKPGLTNALSLDALRKARKWTVHALPVELLESGSPVSEQLSDDNAGEKEKMKREIAPLVLTSRKTTSLQESYKLADLFTIKRGLATGANKFFLLSGEQVSQYQLPAKFLLPVLPASRYVSLDEIGADSEGNPLLERALFLLACNIPECQVAAEYPSLWSYFELGMKRGVNKTYICSHRAPWYSQEKRSAPLFVYSYMGRQKSEGSSPFRFILNRSRAVATNSYHVLYPKNTLQEALHRSPDLLEKLWQTLKNLALEDFLVEGRTYGGGLHKIEPAELANVSIKVKDLPDTLLEVLRVGQPHQGLWQSF